MTRAMLVFCLLFAYATCAYAGEFNPTVNVGDTLLAWKNLPGIDGKPHS